jgi:hypothetical protein
MMKPISGSPAVRSIAMAVTLAAGIHVQPAVAQVVTRTMEAAEDWAFVSLADPEAVLAVADPSSSLAWDIAFQGTDVILNGGSVGSAGVTAICLCQNQWATNDELQQMTPDSELAEFAAVTAESIAPDAAWHPATFAGSPWFKYNLRDEHMIWPTYNTFLVKRDDTVYKLQITGYYSQAGDPRHISFRYEKIAG